MSITKRIMYARDYKEEADKRLSSTGVTSLYSTGSKDLDGFIGGGYGRPDGYEIVLLFGPTGVGKSTVGLNFLADAIKKGKQVGLLVLEDDMPDVSNRLRNILGQEEWEKMNARDNVRCLPEEAMTKAWSLPDLLAYIDWWFSDGVELILLDHLQFAFENAESIKGENEYISQRIFMQKLNQGMKKNGKTIILVSHVNKGKAQGMDKIVGSGAIAQAATKVIEVAEHDEDLADAVSIFLRKSRFTRKPSGHWDIKLINAKIERAYD